MKYKINISDEYKIVNISYNNGNMYGITIPDLNLLLEENYLELLLEKMVENDKIIKMLSLPKTIIEYIIKAIKENINQKDIITFLIENEVMLFSLILNTINSYKNKYNKMKLSHLDEIMFDGNKENLLDIFEFSKKVDIPILIDLSSISLQEYYELVKNYNLEELSNLNIEIYFQEFNENITPFELYETSLLVTTIVEDIQKYNLSPIEQITYAYDMVKRRKYQKDKDNSMKCRNLKNVLEDNDIVCVGYVNVFNSILKCLNINSMGLVSENHLRSIVYVKDNKYNIDGVYVFDPTWDNKRNDEDSNYINNYTYFMMPISTALKYKNSHILCVLPLDYSKIEKLTEEVNEINIAKLNNIDKLFNLINIEEITHTSYLDNSRYEMEKKYNEGRKKYRKKELDPEVLFQILYNVRKIEYYIGMTDSININDIIEGISIKYFKEKCHKEKITSVYEKLDKIFYRAYLKDNLYERREEILRKKNKDNVSLEKDMLNIRLVKTLRKIKNQKAVDNN